MSPYTYVLKFKPTGQLYYGVRIKPKSTPKDDLGVHYFSSSKIVKELIKQHGKDSFRYRIHKTFNSIEEAYNCEHHMLTLIKDKRKWFNRNLGSGLAIASIHKTEEHRKAIGMALRGKKRTGEALKKCQENSILGANARRGMTDSEEVRLKRAESVKKTFNSPGFKQPHRYCVYIIEGIEYIGEKEVVEKYNITRNTLYNRCASEKFPNWIKQKDKIVK
jgi:hypothetical protein